MMFRIWNMMFHSLIFLLSSHPFSFTSSHLKECWSLDHEDQLLLFDLGLNLPLSCLNWRMLQLFLGCNKCNIAGCCILSLSVPSRTSKASPPPPCRFAARIAPLGLAVPRNWSRGRDRARAGCPHAQEDSLRPRRVMPVTTSLSPPRCRLCIHRALLQSHAAAIKPGREHELDTWKLPELLS
jgi:hypothetical protein